MKKLIYINCIVLGLCLVITSSCKDQLNLSPISSIGVEGFWSSPEDVDGGVTAMYHRLRSYDQNLYMLGSSRSEEMAQSQLRNASWKIKYFENTLTANNADMDWQTPYKVIGLANLVIEKTPNIEFPDESVKNNRLAQAYTMRAFMYFVLARAWGDVPLIKEPIEGYNPETTFRERAAVDEIVTLIKDDLEQAISLFPTNDFPEGRATWSKPAANTLKGDVYLWTAKKMGGGTEDLTTALNALEDARNSNVQLLDNFSDVFDYNNKGNQEVIFALHFNRTEGGNHYLRMYAESSVINDSNEETKEKLAPGGAGGAGWWGASEHIRNQFSDNDSRKDASYYEIYHYQDNDSSLVAVPVIKYKGIADAGERLAVDDIIIYRYADLLLMIAEAKNALGQDPSSEINMVRERAYGDDYSSDNVFVNGTKEENDSAILQERMLELAFEGKRWWDIVRFEKAFELVPSLQGREGEVPLLWPLDEDTMVRNSKLTQTPGY